MEKQNEATEQRVEATTSALDDEKNNGLTHRHIKEVNVQSVALADAIAKDKPNYKSKSQMTLYAMMCLCVLSTSLKAPSKSSLSKDIRTVKDSTDHLQLLKKTAS